MALFDAILWDNDGVLVDTEHLYYQATREVMAQAGVTLDVDSYREHFLNAATGAWHLVAQQGFSEVEMEKMREQRNARHSELLETSNLAMPGAQAALKRLHGHVRMGIVTSAWRRHFDMSHRDTDMRRFFEFVLTREDYERSKPNPEPYLLGLSKMGVTPERCLVIEDSQRGLTAASAAGLACWVIPSELSRGADYTAAHAVLESIDDVPQAVLGL
jgi:HAD superfamily hydrolase (TIGR01509 family)